MGLRQRSNKSPTQLMRSMQSKVAEQLQEAVVDYAVDKQQYFNQVVSSWKLKPRFVVKSQMTDKVYYAAVVPTGQHGDKFIWIDIGTGKYGPKRQSYIIQPKNASVLRFQTGYNPRTAPVAKFNQGDGKASGNVVFANEVEHPGIKSRLFNETFDKDNAKAFRKSIRKAIDKGISKAR